MTTTFWYNNPSILFQYNKLTEFYPNINMDLNDKLNAIVRFSLYLSIILYIYNNNINNFFILIFVLGITFFIYTNNIKIHGGDNLTQYTYSTIDNPMKNILVSEIGTNKPPPINDNSDIDTIKYNLNERLFRGVDDLCNTSHSQRQWYTMPNNDQGAFAKWLYDTPSCKNGDKIQCVANIPNRTNLR